MILSLKYYDDNFLREKSDPINQITNEIKKLIDDMIETMDALDGVGLAAAQVGKHLRLFILRPVLKKPDDSCTLGPVEVFINPQLSNPSKETEIMEEGCLSFPGIHESVERPVSIDVSATDLNGKIFKIIAKGFYAREIMHENDHLNGTLFIDRLDKVTRKKIEPQLQAIKEKYKK